MKKLFFILGLLIFSGLLISAVYAENNGIVNRENNSNGKLKNATSTLNLPCVQIALTTRETAIIAAYDVMSASIRTSLITRQTELTTAWGITDNKARRDARNSAWSKFNKTVKEARKAYKASVNTAWKKFHTDSKACKVNTQGVESASSDLSL